MYQFQIVKNYADEDLVRPVSTVQGRGTRISILEPQRTYEVPFNTIQSQMNCYVDKDCETPGPKIFLGQNVRKNLRKQS